MAIPAAFILIAVWILGVAYDFLSMGPYVHVLLAIAVVILAVRSVRSGRHPQS